MRAYNTVMTTNMAHKKTQCYLQTKTRLQNTNSYVTLLASLLLFLFYAFNEGFCFGTLHSIYLEKFQSELKNLTYYQIV